MPACTILIKKKSGSIPPDPLSTNLNPHHYMERKSIHIYISLASRGGGGGGGQTPLVICVCIHFCTYVRIWINLGDKIWHIWGVVDLLS